MPFKLNLNNSSGVPFYKQVINQVIYAVVNGLLVPGEQLPTVRQLAVDLAINLNTVVKAYKELEIRGFVTTQQGTGTFIGDAILKISKEEKTERLRHICQAFIDDVSSQGIEIGDALAMMEEIVSQRKQELTRSSK